MEAWSLLLVDFSDLREMQDEIVQYLSDAALSSLSLLNCSWWKRTEARLRARFIALISLSQFKKRDARGYEWTGRYTQGMVTSPDSFLDLPVFSIRPQPEYGFEVHVNSAGIFDYSSSILLNKVTHLERLWSTDYYAAFLTWLPMGNAADSWASALMQSKKTPHFTATFLRAFARQNPKGALACSTDFAAGNFKAHTWSSSSFFGVANLALFERELLTVKALYEELMQK